MRLRLEPVALLLRAGVRVRVKEMDKLGLGLCVEEAQALGEREGVPLRVRLGRGLREKEGEGEGVRERTGEKEGTGLTLGSPVEMEERVMLGQEEVLSDSRGEREEEGE